MTFSCKNFDFNTEDCLKLKTDCIMGRPGCLLEGKVTFSEEIEKKLKDLEDTSKERKKRRHKRQD
ncbi:MAG: hypothetical protein QNK14_11540 [Desulfobacterales bacterium]|jgi:hypothetical protein|nr:hypothetical protein [Desulfobacterales bacterium]